MTKQQFIAIGTEDRKWIMQHLNISKGALSRALNFQGNSPRDKMLRKVALQHGGVLMIATPVK